MKAMKKRFIPLLLVCALLLAGAASAISVATVDPQFSYADDPNRQQYTPKHCMIQLTPSAVKFTNMQWQAFWTPYGDLDYWEGEIRVHDDNVLSPTLLEVYSSCSSVKSDLPDCFKEYDEDDLTLGCNISKINQFTTYYGTLNVIEGWRYDAGIALMFESEYGSPRVDVGNFEDGLPLRYQYYDTKTPFDTALSPILSW